MKTNTENVEKAIILTYEDKKGNDRSILYLRTESSKTFRIGVIRDKKQED